MGIDPPREERRVRFERLAFGGVLLVTIGLAWVFMPDDTPPSELPGLAAPGAETAAGDASDADTAAGEAEPERRSRRAPDPVASTSLAAPLKPFASLVLPRDALPTSGPLVVYFDLEAPSRDDEPRPVRLLSQPDHELLELEGVLDPSRRIARVEIDPARLVRGHYLVEVETTEISHFPLRRYGLVVEE